MNEALPRAERRLATVWLGLVAITAASWWLGSKHGPDAFERNAAITVSVILLALVKVRFVVREFMELRHQSVGMQQLGDACIVIIGIVLLGFYTLPL